MKIPVMFYVSLTTLLLITLVIMVSMNMAFSWVFYLTCAGQAMVVLMVYKVLRDNYKTDKTFSDFYEDRPLSEIENYR